MFINILLLFTTESDFGREKQPVGFIVNHNNI